MSVNDPLTPRARYHLDLTDAEAKDLRALIEPGRLRRKPARRRRETEDYAATLIRMLDRLGERAEGDVDQLPAVDAIARAAADALRTHVLRCRAIGVSWAEIGERLGTTRQAAQQRFGRNW